MAKTHAWLCADHSLPRNGAEEVQERSRQPNAAKLSQTFVVHESMG